MKLIFLLFTLTTAIELTPDNWEEQTMGKTIFVKMFAPWCGHCKKMKPDWDKLMEEYKGSDTVIVADVDCINAGKAICDSNGVKGFPTIKYGSPTSLEDYKGGRSAAELGKFVAGLKPPCNVDTLEHCSDNQKEQINNHKGKSDQELQQLIDTHVHAVGIIEKTFNDGVEGLQSQFQQMQEDKDIAYRQLTDISIAKSLLGKTKTEL
tara:strand:+ start:12499 stop:13119 length:621 start_codon:yes stop_codon:yes gene_type:complete